MNDEIATPSEFPKEGSSASGTSSSWTVEARCTSPRPKEIGGVLMDNRWQALSWTDGHGFGVKDGPRWLFEGRNFGHLSYPAAQAMRWWFIANAYAANEDGGLETRLVRHVIEYKRSERAVAAEEVTDARMHRAY